MRDLDAQVEARKRRMREAKEKELEEERRFEEKLRKDREEILR